MMNNFICLHLMFSLVALSISAENAQPHIIHIVADDLGWNDVSFHGSEIRTPAIDKLASESVVLNRFYVTPICSPTRAGMLTGRYPFHFGIWGGVVSPSQRHGLPPSEQTLPELLEEAGYRKRVLLGKWHLGLASDKFHPLNHGFTDFYGHYNGAIDYFSRKRFGELDWHRNHQSVHEQGYSTDLLADEAVRLIENSNDEFPLYMCIAFNAPHSPIQAKESDLDKVGFDPSGPRAKNTVSGIARREKSPDYGANGKGNTVRQTFAAMVTSLDENIGRIMRALKNKGMKENTIVIFHSDNGGIPNHGGDNRPLRGNKFTTWEGGVRVVAMIRWPSKLPGGTIYPSVSGYIDLVPTLTSAVGLKTPPNLDGINLLPFLKGTHPPENRSLILDEKTIVTDRWKWKDDSLFDLKNDPGELNPVKHTPDAITARLKTQLAKFNDLKGSQNLTRLPKPEKWPPHEWKLPVEPAYP